MEKEAQPKNFETRIADRAKSIFAAFGTIATDFYLETGIYFVGGFNASLVAWDIYTDLLASSQPLPYAIALAAIAFIAVEGLAVYLVGAAAKTGNGWLWFFSGCFALFLTYAHAVEANTNNSVISEYITIAIPIFVVVGYWARTIKADVENAALQIENDLARQQRIEDEERARQKQIEDEERNRQQEIEAQKLAHELEMERLKEANKQAQKLARIEAKKSQTVPDVSRQTVPDVSQDKTLETLKKEIIAELGRERPNMTQLARRLDIGRGTLYRHLGTLAETGEIVKNGNGYEVK